MTKRSFFTGGSGKAGHAAVAQAEYDILNLDLKPLDCPGTP
jgi:UDP-glucose 4-epimerase